VVKEREREQGERKRKRGIRRGGKDKLLYEKGVRRSE
jgi:hypothetical protein